MASELATAPQLTNGNAVDGHQSTTNGEHLPSAIPSVPILNTEDAQSSIQNSQPQNEPSLSLKETTSTSVDPDPAGPTPVEDVGSGIQPISDFIPKDASNLSHPTPPPDEPLLTGAADVNVEMTDAPEDVPIVEEPQPQSRSALEPDLPATSTALAESVPAPVSIPAPVPASVAAPISALLSAPAPAPTPAPSLPTAPIVTPVPAPVSASTESSLVRHREDDEYDAPAAKRSKVEEESYVDSIPAEPMVTDPPSDVLASSEAIESRELDQNDSEEQTAAVSQPSIDGPPVLNTADLPPSSVDEVKPKLPPPSALALAEIPASATTQSHEPLIVEKVEPAPETAVISAPIPADEKPVVPAPAETEPSAQTQADAVLPTAPPTQAAEPTSTATVTATAGTAAAPAPASKPTATGASFPPPSTTKYDARPLTSVQKATLQEKMKNLKKTKSSLAFLKPVDAIALNIPNYTEVIKTPMDLSTMEAKLKEGQYKSVQDFVSDFDLMLANTRRFNGDAHPVTQAGMSMDAYFRRMMETVPSADIPAPPPKAPKKRSPSVPRENRRESRNAAVVAAAAIAPPAPAPAPVPAATSPTTTYALNNDGTPQLRRDSNRPQRAIKPPQNREITYAKPKRKEHQLELRFCEYVLEEVRSIKYQSMNHVFVQPVDPVALNIPHYRQIVKHPMDLTTMSQKLKGGQYATAGEFRKDFELMIKNCLAFNPVGNPVRDLGIQFQREFDALWSNKSKWEKQNQPASNRASSASVDGDSADEEEEESDAGEDDKEATIRALQKQLAEMQSALSGLGGGKPAKTKKPKAPKSGSKKAGGITSIKTKTTKSGPAKPKKVRQVTYEEKQEISEAVGNMSEQQVTKLTTIITTNCEKYRDMEEMELEIDDLPNDVQAKLLEYVRSIFGKPKKHVREPSPDDAAAIDDDDFEPEHRGRGGGGKRKKHKPMGKKEQTDTIRSLQDKLAQFSNVGTSGSESPSNSGFRAAHAQAESSGDEESEESEEE